MPEHADHAFEQLKADIQKWCANQVLGTLLTVREQDGDLWIMARKDDTSMDLKARRDMNVYLVAASRKRRSCYLARMYVSEMRGYSIVITQRTGKGKGKSAFLFRHADGTEKIAADKANAVFDEAAFTKLLCDWMAAYFSLKSVYYYA